MITDDQAREALDLITERANAKRRLQGTIIAKRGRNVSVLVDGENAGVVTAYRGSYTPSVGAGVTIERIVNTSFYRVVGIRDAALGAANSAAFDFEVQGIELFYPLALEAINQASYNTGDGLEITIYNVQYVDYDKLWHHIASTALDLITYVPIADSVWIVIYVDLATDALLVYTHTPTATPEGGWLDAVNGLLSSTGSIVPILAIQLDADMEEWGDAWRTIMRGYSYVGKKIVRIPYYSPRDISEITSAADEVSYAPIDTGDWDTIPDLVSEALDEGIDRVKAIEGLLPVGAIVGDTDSQTLINKTIDADDNTITGVGSSEVIADLITGQAAITTIDGTNDYFLIYDATDGLLKKVAASNVGTGGGGGGGSGGYKLRDTSTLLYDGILGSDGTFDVYNTDLILGVGDLEDYESLTCILEGRTTFAAENGGVYMFYNNDKVVGNYRHARHYGGQDHLSGQATTPQIAFIGAGTASTDSMSPVEIVIFNPSGGYKKTARVLSQTIGIGYYTMTFAHVWQDTSVITSIHFEPDGYPTHVFVAGTRLRIYGTKNESIGGGAVCSNANVSNPPTDAELDSAFGTPATVGDGFIGIVDDNNAATNVYIAFAKGSNWYTILGTKAL